MSTKSLTARRMKHLKGKYGLKGKMTPGRLTEAHRAHKTTATHTRKAHKWTPENTQGARFIQSNSPSRFTKGAKSPMKKPSLLTETIKGLPSAALRLGSDVTRVASGLGTIYGTGGRSGAEAVRGGIKDFGRAVQGKPDNTGMDYLGNKLGNSGNKSYKTKASHMACKTCGSKSHATHLKMKLTATKPQGRGIVRALHQKGTTGNFKRIEKAQGKGAAIGALQNKLARIRGQKIPYGGKK